MDQPAGAMNQVSYALVVRHLLPIPTLCKPSKFKVEISFISTKFHLIHTISTGDLGKELELYGGEWGIVDLGTYIIGNNGKWNSDVDHTETESMFSLKLTGIDLAGTIYPANVKHIVRRVIGVSPRYYTKNWGANREVVGDMIGNDVVSLDQVMDLGPESYASFEGSFQLQQAVSDGNVIEISVTCDYYTLSTNNYGQIFQFPISIETITPHAAYTDNAILRSGDREVPSIVVNVKNDSSNQTSVSRIFSLNFRFKIKNYLSSGNYKFRVDLFNHNTTGGMIRVHTVTTSTRLVTITHNWIDRDEE